MKAIARMRKIGGSLVVTVPKEIVEEKSLREGEIIEITIEKPKRSFFGTVKDIGQIKNEDKFSGQLEEDD